MWNGAAATLKASPTKISATPAKSSPSGIGPAAPLTVSAIRARFVVPVAP